MQEQDFLSIIQSAIGNEFIGDDCAYLKDLGIVVTQDSLVENIHFKQDWCTPYLLGYKAVAVNISDIIASGAKPAYITIALSLPSCISEDFVKEFYKGAKDSLYGAKIVGGDITGSKKDIMISITAIGTTQGRNISSRSFAKEGYAVVVKGMHGAGAAGLRELMTGGNNKDLVNAHLKPILEEEFSRDIAESVNTDYAMMDTSDGLGDALFKIAEASNVTIKVDYNKIPKPDCVTREQVLFGGEDYKLVAVIPQNFATNSKGTIIGKVFPFNGNRLIIDDVLYNNYDDLQLFNHFEP